MVTKVNRGLQLKIMRLRAGLRQYDLAARVGIAPNRLSEIETGRRKPSDELVNRILQAIKGNQNDQTDRKR